MDMHVDFHLRALQLALPSAQRPSRAMIRSASPDLPRTLTQICFSRPFQNSDPDLLPQNSDPDLFPQNSPEFGPRPVPPELPQNSDPDLLPRPFHECDLLLTQFSTQMPFSEERHHRPSSFNTPKPFLTPSSVLRTFTGT